MTDRQLELLRQQLPDIAAVLNGEFVQEAVSAGKVRHAGLLAVAATRVLHTALLDVVALMSHREDRRDGASTALMRLTGLTLRLCEASEAQANGDSSALAQSAQTQIEDSEELGDIKALAEDGLLSPLAVAATMACDHMTQAVNDGQVAAVRCIRVIMLVCARESVRDAVVERWRRIVEDEEL